MSASDVVVVGGGVIGLAPAWRCAQRGLRVTVVDPCGTVVAAWDAADLVHLRDLHAFQASLGVPPQILSARDLRALEPACAAGLPGGLLASEDHQVDNRRLVRALLQVIHHNHITVVRQSARSIGTEVEVQDGIRIAAGTVVLAAGDLLGGFGRITRGMAAAVDGAGAPRSTWPDVVLREGAIVEILTAVQGG